MHKSVYYIKTCKLSISTSRHSISKGKSIMILEFCKCKDGFIIEKLLSIIYHINLPYRGLEWKSRKSRDTWSNRQIWPWNKKQSRAKVNRVLPREPTGHSNLGLPTTQEMLWKCCPQYANKFRKLSSGHRTGKRSVFIPIPKKGNAKECSNYHKLCSFHNLAR